MQKLDHNIGFHEKHHFFAENRQKSPKIVIITLTPGQGSCYNYYFWQKKCCFFLKNQSCG
jgi:hypothetical protein